MAILQQHPTATTRHFGWYGSCDSSGDCAPFPLLTGAGWSWAHTVGLNITTGKSDIFLRVEVMRDQASMPFQIMPYDGQASSPIALAFGSPLRQLECGHIYQIDLMPGTGSVDIPHLVAVSSDDDSAGYVTEDCTSSESVVITPTPTPSPTPTLAPIVPVDCCPAGYYEIVATGSSVSSDLGVTIQGFHDGAKVCTAAPVGGIPEHFDVILFGLSIGILTVPRIPEGSIMENDNIDVHYTYNNNCYTGNLDEENNRLSLELV